MIWFLVQCLNHYIKVFCFKLFPLFMSSTQEIFIMGQLSGQNEINIIKTWLIVARTLTASIDKFSIHPSISLTNLKNLQSISVIFSRSLLGSSRRVVKLCIAFCLCLTIIIELHCTNYQKHLKISFTISRNFKRKNHIKIQWNVFNSLARFQIL